MHQQARKTGHIEACWVVLLGDGAAMPLIASLPAGAWRYQRRGVAGELWRMGALALGSLGAGEHSPRVLIVRALGFAEDISNLNFKKDVLHGDNGNNKGQS